MFEILHMCEEYDLCAMCEICSKSKRDMTCIRDVLGV